MESLLGFYHHLEQMFRREPWFLLFLLIEVPIGGVLLLLLAWLDVWILVVLHTWLQRDVDVLAAGGAAHRRMV